MGRQQTNAFIILHCVKTSGHLPAHRGFAESALACRSLALQGATPALSSRGLSLCQAPGGAIAWPDDQTDLMVLKYTSHEQPLWAFFICRSPGSPLSLDTPGKTDTSRRLWCGSFENSLGNMISLEGYIAIVFFVCSVSKMRMYSARKGCTMHSQSHNNRILKNYGVIYPSRPSLFPSES